MCPDKLPFGDKRRCLLYEKTNLLSIAPFMTGPKKQPCLPAGLHELVVLGLVQFFFQPSLFLRGNRGSPGLAAATGRYGFCVQMGITSLQFGYKKHMGLLEKSHH